jgi:hypothetical protein
MEPPQAAEVRARRHELPQRHGAKPPQGELLKDRLVVDTSKIATRRRWSMRGCWLLLAVCASVALHAALVPMLVVRSAPRASPTLPKIMSSSIDRLAAPSLADAYARAADAVASRPADGKTFEVRTAAIATDARAADSPVSTNVFVPQIDAPMLAYHSGPLVLPSWLDRELPSARRKAHQPPPQMERPPVEIVGLINDPGPGWILAGRDPKRRPELVKSYGGNTVSESAVEAGLRWIARHQDPEGCWRLDGFANVPACGGACSHPGLTTDTGGTALALLPFISAGLTHTQGRYTDTVGKGLRWLVEHQRPDGGWDDTDNVRNYAGAIATIVLCETYALTHDERLRGPAQQAAAYIAVSQSEAGWRYKGGQQGDTSVTAWQLMALHSAQTAGFPVPEETLTLASAFLDAMQMPDKGLFAYMQGLPVTETMTAAGLLARQYSGWQHNDPALIAGVEYLTQNFPDRKHANMYYWYYATQVMHNLGSDPWQQWNLRLRDLLIEMQEKQGHMAGSWTPVGYHDLPGGRLYMTSLAVCTLEIYYRYLPLYGGRESLHPQPKPMQAAAK